MVVLRRQLRGNPRSAAWMVKVKAMEKVEAIMKVMAMVRWMALASLEEDSHKF
jgi:hypothetical protein